MQSSAGNADNQPVRILHLESDPQGDNGIRNALKAEGLACRITRIARVDQFESTLARSAFDLILANWTLPGLSPLSALETAQRICPSVPFIFLFGAPGDRLAIEALKNGASDYLLEDQLPQLGLSVRRALRAARERAAQHNAEARLRDRDELFRQITENMDDLVSILDCQGRHLFNSPSFRKFGLDPDAWTGVSAFNHAVPEDLPRVQRVFATLVQTGENQHTDFRTILPDGRLRHFEARGNVVRDSEGRVQGAVIVARDVTERKLVEERLRLLEAAVQNADEAFLITDAQLTPPGPEVVFVNAAFCAMTGYPANEVIGKPRGEASASKGSSDPVHTIRTHRNWAGPLRGEGLTRRRDGSEFWMEWYSMPLRDSQDRVTHYLVVQRDVTAKKRAEAQIHEQAALLDHAHDAICVMDMEQKILYWNHGSERLFGYDATEVVGNSAVSLLFHGDQSSLALALKGLISRGEWRGEITHRAQAGHEVYVESRWTLLRDERGRPKSILLINTDMTERKLAEMKVREQAALLDQAQDAIYVCDLDRRITYWNKGAERLYGWRGSEVLGRRASELLSGEGLREREEIWTTAIEAGEWSGELPQTTRSGRQLIVASRRTVLRDPRGLNVAVLHINTDITERKHLETQFLRSQRLENIGALAGGIAHDLNNILSPILMVTDVLREDLLDEESRQMMDTVKSSAERGADLVRQILSFARGVGGEPAVFDLRHVVKDVVRMARSTFLPSIQIETRMLEDLRAVRGDPTRLHQVLMNLCVNARDAMPDGGKLSVTAENLVLKDRTVPGQPKPVSGQYVRLAVIDTGTGIPPHLQEKIFLPFFTTKPVGLGTGLGLSTVANIVRDHGGFVEVHSQVGEGSAFYVYLPSTLKTAVVAEVKKAPEPPLGHGERILLVDDDRAVLEMTRQALKAYHYEVLLASNGAEALEAYQNRTLPIDLVITDLQMPVMDGPSFVREMHRLDPRLKIICVSGLASESKLADLDRGKVAILLGKPYTAERLLSTIQQVLGS